MKTYRLPYSNVDIDVSDSNIITRVSTIDFVTTILEMKLSDWAIEKIEIDSIPLWLDLFIYEIGTKLPENNEDFEKIVVDSWKDWCTENVLVGNQLGHYEFGEGWMAHDMIDYYGKLRADGSLFQRRYDFTNADIEVRIKSEQNA